VREEIERKLGLAPQGDEEALVPRWVALGFLVFTVGLVPWTVWLFVSLPDDHLARHWALAWGGFDVGLGISLGLTALLLLRRSPFAGVAAAASGTLLVCDAWFDIVTSRGTDELLQAVALALVAELPLAAVCFWIARNIERVLADARPHLERLGFRIRNRRLEPPPSLRTRAPR
jgi:hypothetical protein